MRLQTYLVPRVTLSRVHLMLLIDAVEQVAGSEGMIYYFRAGQMYINVSWIF